MDALNLRTREMAIITTGRMVIISVETLADFSLPVNIEHYSKMIAFNAYASRGALLSLWHEITSKLNAIRRSVCRLS